MPENLSQIRIEDADLSSIPAIGGAIRCDVSHFGIRLMPPAFVNCTRILRESGNSSHRGSYE
jgi:hypothetical protein